jgi:hypothetical protein
LRGYVDLIEEIKEGTKKFANIKSFLIPKFHHTLKVHQVKLNGACGTNRPTADEKRIQYFNPEISTEELTREMLGG